MATFADKTGQAWTVDLTVADLKPLREEYRIDLKDALDERMESLSPWLGEPEQLITLLWHFCQDEAAARKVEPEAFGRLMNGKALRDAAVAVVEAVFDFSHGPKAAAEMAQNLRAELDGADGRMGGVVVQAFERVRSKNSAGNSGAPSALTPAPSA